MALSILEKLARLRAWTHQQGKRHGSFSPGVESLEKRELLSAAPLLQISSNGRYLVAAGTNQPFYLVGDSVWGGLPADITPAQASQYFQTRASEGFNAVLMNAGDGLADNNGDLPFLQDINGNPATATSVFNVATPNPVYWSYIDNLINTASQNGIEVMLNVAETYGPNNGTRDTTFLANNSIANLTAFGQFLGQRYANVNNIIWMFGDDYYETSTLDNAMAAMMQGIRQFDTKHLMTLEWEGSNFTPHMASFDETALRQYLNLNGIYRYPTEEGPFRPDYLAEYNRSDFGPIFNIETDYENGFHNPTEANIREGHYSFLVDGATGDMYGNDAMGGFNFATGWQTQLTSEGSHEMTYYANLVNSIPWYNLIPDQSGTVFQGVGTPTSSSYGSGDYSGAYTADGTLALAYKPSTGTGSQSITVNMNKMSAPITAQWYDPTNGTYTTIGTNLANSGTMTFNTPTANSSGIDNDFVLILKATPSTNQAPSITSANNAAFTAGSAGTFTVTATGSPTPTLSESGTLPSGVTFNTSTGVLSGTPATGTGGTYNLVFTASNGVGSSATQNFTLTIKQAPAITSASNAAFTVGSAGSFSLTDTGFPAPTWNELGTLPSGVSFNATTGVLSGTPAAGSNGIYNLVVTAGNGVGSNAAQNLTLTVNPATTGTMVLAIAAGNGTVGSFVADADFSGGSVSGGTTATINTSGVTNPAPASVWQHGRYGNMTYTIPNLTPGASYTIKLDFVEYVWNAAGARVFNVAINSTQVLSNFDIFAAAGGENIAIAKSFSATASAAGTISITFTTLVNNAIVSGIEISTSTAATAPAITTQPASQTVTAGQSASFRVAASGTAPFTYQWQKSVNGTWTNLGTNSATFSIASVAATDAGQYRVTISNSAGQVTSSTATLTVNVAPSITIQPASQTVAVGQTASFSVAASGTAPLTYQWQKSVNGTWTNLGSSSATFSISSTASTDAGSYRVVVSNSVGSVISNVVTLTVTTSSAPVIAIAAGNGAVGSFVADTDFSGGSISGGTTAAINTSGITNPPPQSVLQHGRYGNMTYTIPNLTPGATYTVRLDFVEYYWSAAGSRVFNVGINGTQVLSNFDIFAAAGGKNIAIARSFTATASSSGTITISFTSLVDNAMINGIEIFTAG